MRLALPAVIVVTIVMAAALVACPSAPEPRPDPVGPTPAAAVPLLFAPLFDRLASARYAWTFDRPATGDAPAVHYTSVVACSTEAPVHLGDGLTAIGWRCFEDLDTPPLDPSVVADGLDLAWLASPTDLWKVAAVPRSAADAGALTQRAPYLAGAPVAVASAVGDGADGGGSETTVSQEAIGEAIAWCRKDTVTGPAGVVRGEELCFEASRGIIERRVVGRLGPSVEKLVLVAPAPSGPR